MKKRSGHRRAAPERPAGGDSPVSRSMPSAVTHHDEEDGAKHAEARECGESAASPLPHSTPLGTPQSIDAKAHDDTPLAVVEQPPTESLCAPDGPPASFPAYTMGWSSSKMAITAACGKGHGCAEASEPQRAPVAAGKPTRGLMRHGGGAPGYLFAGSQGRVDNIIDLRNIHSHRKCPSLLDVPPGAASCGDAGEHLTCVEGGEGARGYRGGEKRSVGCGPTTSLTPNGAHRGKSSSRAAAYRANGGRSSLSGPSRPSSQGKLRISAHSDTPPSTSMISGSHPMHADALGSPVVGPTAVFRRRQTNSDPPPSKVLDFLFLGSVRDANNADFLRANNIKTIINVSSEEYWAVDQSITVYQFSIQDSVNSNIVPFFRPTAQIIDRVRRRFYEALANGDTESMRRVLVHCQKGRSRSATVVLAYLIRRNGWNVAEALRYVSQRRPCIEPNLGFIEALRECQESMGPLVRDKLCTELCLAVRNISCDTTTEAVSSVFEAQVGCVREVVKHTRQGATSTVSHSDACTTDHATAPQRSSAVAGGPPHDASATQSGSSAKAAAGGAREGTHQVAAPVLASQGHTAPLPAHSPLSGVLADSLVAPPPVRAPCDKEDTGSGEAEIGEGDQRNLADGEACGSSESWPASRPYSRCVSTHASGRRSPVALLPLTMRTATVTAAPMPHGLSARSQRSPSFTLRRAAHAPPKDSALFLVFFASRECVMRAMKVMESNPGLLEKLKLIHGRRLKLSLPTKLMNARKATAVGGD